MRGADGRRTIEVVTAIYQAAIEDRTVELPIRTDGAYYTGEGVLANAPRYSTKARSVDQLDGFVTVGESGDTQA